MSVGYAGIGKMCNQYYICINSRGSRPCLYSLITQLLPCFSELRQRHFKSCWKRSLVNHERSSRGVSIKRNAFKRYTTTVPNGYAVSHTRCCNVCLCVLSYTGTCTETLRCQHLYKNDNHFARQFFFMIFSINFYSIVVCRSIGFIN